jgi:hypothetical protein
VREDQATTVPDGAVVDDEPLGVDDVDGTMLVEVVLLEVDEVVLLEVDEVAAVDAVESDVLGTGVA